MKSKGVQLVGVVHEISEGHDEFHNDFFGGDRAIFLDKAKQFYSGGRGGLFTLLHPTVLARMASTKVKGNLKGDGTVLGGVFVFGPHMQEILFYHQEQLFGDHADVSSTCYISPWHLLLLL